MADIFQDHRNFYLTVIEKVVHFVTLFVSFQHRSNKEGQLNPRESFGWMSEPIERDTITCSQQWKAATTAKNWKSERETFFKVNIADRPSGSVFEPASFLGLIGSESLFRQAAAVVLFLSSSSWFSILTSDLRFFGLGWTQMWHHS